MARRTPNWNEGDDTKQRVSAPDSIGKVVHIPFGLDILVALRRTSEYVIPGKRRSSEPKSGIAVSSPYSLRRALNKASSSLNVQKPSLYKDREHRQGITFWVQRTKHRIKKKDEFSTYFHSF